MSITDRTDLLSAETTQPLLGGASYSLANRIRRIMWGVAWKLLASWTPAPMHRWRVALLRLFGADVHPTAHVYGTVKIWLPTNLKMERHACLGPGAQCYNMAKIVLQEHAIVSQGANLCAGTHDVDDEHFQLVAKPITIEAHAWVAAEAFIGPGVTVAKNSVVGARAVVFKDTEPDGIYIGNPAVFKRLRGVK